MTLTQKERDLRALSEAALQVENALDIRDKLIRQYSQEGYSLREIANAVAMSHEKVRSLVRSKEKIWYRGLWVCPECHRPDGHDNDCPASTIPADQT